ISRNLSSDFLASSTRHKRSASALENRLPADSASRPISPASIARFTSASLRSSGELFFIDRIRAQASSIVSILLRFFSAAFDKLPPPALSAGLRMFNRNLGSVKLSTSLFDIHFVIIRLYFAKIIVSPFVKAPAVAYV